MLNSIRVRTGLRLAAVGLLIIGAQDVAAQNMGRSSGKGGGAALRTGGGGGDRDTGSHAIGDMGSARATIKGYAPQIDSEESQSVGVLTVLLVEEKKSLKLNVPADLKVDLGGKIIGPEEFEEGLPKGLEVDIQWDAEKSVLKKSKAKLVRAISPTAYEIEGEVDGYDPKTESLMISAIPAAGALWPDQQRDQREGGNKKNNSRNAKAAEPIVRKFRARTFQDGSKVMDELERTLSIQDIESGKPYKAKIALAGRRDAYILEFIVLLPESEKLAARPQTPPTDTRAGEGEQPPQPPPKLRFGP